ncbi:glutathione peroxidase [Vagococcus sp. BWB3-3]|uniref:Glutathione peroxidase n=1 Tax=Vagococcus allomyrinae TaxID=2794353 RepID=A0A940P7P6_9ENTE|nr:glutathione peroxidase [Vagococcus allomyrinae]MBP1039467.1 glutathione peroxidase [Vagococcus allomyrinae]
MTIYDYAATLENGETYSLEKYKGQILIIVNTATKCGLAPQFEDLEKIYETYQDQGLEILGFPSNQFKQELSTSEEASEACRLTYGVTFPMHAISKLSGEDANPIFTYLVDNTTGVLGSKIKWNFTKFLIDQEGNIVKRYAPKDSPKKMIGDIEALLGKK